MQVKWYCDGCGNETHAECENIYSQLDCKVCGRSMIPDLPQDEEDMNDEQIIREVSEAVEHRDFLQNAGEYIKLYGSQEVWDYIEQNENASVRFQYRNVFIKAGGTIPEGEPITI